MSTLVVLLTLVALVTCTAGSCPDGYRCEWENGWFVLHCNPIVGDGRYDTVSGTITDLPTNAERLKISCFSLHVPVQLNFANLSSVQELLVDHVNAKSKNQLFKGVTNITHLVLRNLSWTRIEKHTFSGLSNLMSLTIERLEDLKSMDANILKPLLSLQSLKFRYVGSIPNALNYTDYARVIGGIASSNFHTLMLYAIHSLRHPEIKFNINDLFVYGRVNRTLKSLDLGRNFIATFSGSPKSTLPVIEHISLAENVLIGQTHLSKFWFELLTLSHLKNLDISGMNTLASDIYRGTLTSLVVDNDVNTFSLDVPLGPDLESVSIANTIFIASKLTIASFITITINHFSFVDKYDVLKYIDISNARSTANATFSVGKLRAVEYFNLHNVNLEGTVAGLFKKMPNLTVLLLGDTEICSAVANDTENRMFHNNRKLRVLDLARCHLTEIPPKEFSSLLQLQNLNLSGNSLHEFHVELQSMGALRMLNLSHNKLTTLSVVTRKELDNLTVHVDLSGNPLDCRCNNTEFIRWVLASHERFLNKHDTYCVDRNNTWNLFPKRGITVFETLCHGNTSRNNSGYATTKSNDQSTVPYDGGANIAWKYVVLISLSVILVVSAVVVPLAVYVCRRYRWKLAMLSHRFRNGATSSGLEDEDKYKRDAFICFNSNDRAWVCNDLLQHMEKHEISTIIHHRDFLPGSVLEESIQESIDKCRFTVLVLSPDFLSSNWCLLEMHLARSRIISQGRDVIIPIILREFQTSQLTRTLESILSRSYLEWTDDPEGQTLFWDKLVTKLKQGGNIRPLQM